MSSVLLGASSADQLMENIGAIQVSHPTLATPALAADSVWALAFLVSS